MWLQRSCIRINTRLLIISQGALSLLCLTFTACCFLEILINIIKNSHSSSNALQSQSPGLGNIQGYLRVMRDCRFTMLWRNFAHLSVIFHARHIKIQLLNTINQRLGSLRNQQEPSKNFFLQPVKIISQFQRFLLVIIFLYLVHDHVWKKCSKVGYKCSFLVINAQF